MGTLEEFIMIALENRQTREVTTKVFKCLIGCHEKEVEQLFLLTIEAGT